MAEKPSIPQVVARFAAYYGQHPTWGSLHIVLDDGNVRTGDVEFCIQWAEDNGDSEGAELGRILLSMSSTQRRKLPVAVHRLQLTPR